MWLPHYSLQYGEMSPKCEFWRDDTEPLIGKNDRFWLLWEIFKDYIQQNVIMAVLRKANSHSIDTFRLVRNR